jgi:hypothetical protein
MPIMIVHGNVVQHLHPESKGNCTAAERQQIYKPIRTVDMTCS